MFIVGIHQKDRALLEFIQLYFGVGKIYKHGKNSYKYQVSSLKDITTNIIPHLKKYPLLTQKHADFVLFMLIVDLMNCKEHLTKDGLRKILAIRASINNGLAGRLKAAFSDIIPVQRPLVNLEEISDPN
jgi:hypothetical protein